MYRLAEELKTVKRWDSSAMREMNAGNSASSWKIIKYKYPTSHPISISDLVHLRHPQLPHVGDPLDTVAADEDGHDDQADMGQPHLLLVNKHFL